MEKIDYERIGKFLMLTNKSKLAEDLGVIPDRIVHLNMCFKDGLFERLDRHALEFFKKREKENKK